MKCHKGFKGLAKAARIIATAGLAFASLLVPARAADSVSASDQDGYSRLSFTFAPAGHVTAKVTGGILTLTFDRKVTIDPKQLVTLMGAAVQGVRADPDGMTLRFALSQPLQLHQSSIGNRAVVDLAPQGFTGTMPDLTVPPPPPKTADAATLPELKLRTGSYANFTRLVFDWPQDVSYSVSASAGKINIRFGAMVRPDLSAITRFQPPWVKTATWRLDGNGGTIVEIGTDSDSGFHDFKDGTKISLDILAPKTDATAYAPPGSAKPQITQMPTTAEAQAQAIVNTANQLAGKNKPAPAPTPPAKPADVKTADAKGATPSSAGAAIPALASADSTSQIQVTDSRLTKDGAILNFRHAGVSGSAVFIRGLTAWVVLQNAPVFDPAALKSALSGFAAGLEASSSPGLSILRITLKQPEQIAAQGIGGDLRVVIAPDAVNSAIAIGFARNQDDPTRASFTTLLPGADHVFELTDPVTGDVLTVLPAAAGRAMLSPRSYAEFATLQTATGLVLTPYTDDLSVKVANARVTITRPGGLSLTPPQMPVAQSPSALASNGDGPSYLILACWGLMTGGSFLAT